MELGILTISQEEAEARVAEYEGVLAAQRSAEDEAILSAYRAAKRGLPVISLMRAFELGGYHPNGLPRLAITRADATECWVRVDTPHDVGTRMTFSDTQFHRGQGALVGKHTTVVTGPPREKGQNRWNARTIVPPVPPRHRPKRGRIRNYHILWEVEEWMPVPPRDPALLRHIRGDLWSVQAVWDLTELEQLVLTQRRTPQR